MLCFFVFSCFLWFHLFHFEYVKDFTIFEVSRCRTISRNLTAPLTSLATNPSPYCPNRLAIASTPPKRKSLPRAWTSTISPAVAQALSTSRQWHTREDRALRSPISHLRSPISPLPAPRSPLPASPQNPHSRQSDRLLQVFHTRLILPHATIMPPQQKFFSLLDRKTR